MKTVVIDYGSGNLRSAAKALAAAGADVLEWSSSHSPFLSHPDLVADLVARYAEAGPG